MVCMVDKGAVTVVTCTVKSISIEAIKTRAVITSLNISTVGKHVAEMLPKNTLVYIYVR